MYSLGYVTQQVLEDSSFNLENWLMEKYVDKFARTENNDFLNGSGANESRGLLTYTNADGYGSIEQVASTVSASLAADDLYSLQDSLFEPFQQNASWLMRRATVSAIRKMKDGLGRYLLDMDGDLANGYSAMLLGRPVVKGADMPALGSGNLAIAYGDFKKCYLIVDRIGISVLRDPFSAKPYVQFYARKRVGGGVRNYQAVKILACLA
jgi:HK97 family phage major capsid protein